MRVCVISLLVSSVAFVACNHDTQPVPQSDIALTSSLEITSIYTGLSIQDYLGQYSLVAILDMGVSTGNAFLHGFYTDQDQNEYSLDSEATTVRLKISEDPSLTIEGMPGFSLEYSASVESLGINVDVVGSTWADLASIEYFDKLIYTSAGILTVNVFGETIIMDTTLTYDDPGELVGGASIETNVVEVTEE